MSNRSLEHFLNPLMHRDHYRGQLFKKKKKKKKYMLCPQEGKKPSECLKEGHCKGLQVAFFECKRSMVSFQYPFLNCLGEKKVF